jgi:hypothetical protein
MLLYNSTESRPQARVGGSWINLYGSIGLTDLSATAINPGTPNDGYALVYDDVSGEYDLKDISIVERIHFNSNFDTFSPPLLFQGGETFTSLISESKITIDKIEYRLDTTDTWTDVGGTTIVDINNIVPSAGTQWELRFIVDYGTNDGESSVVLKYRE